MPKRLDDRERRRLRTIRERHGEDFLSRNARRAASFSSTQFNSQTGSAAAKKRWADVRRRKREGLNNVPKQ